MCVTLRRKAPSKTTQYGGCTVTRRRSRGQRDAHALEYGAAALLQVRVVLAVGEAEHEPVLAAVLLHVGDHVTHALRHGLALHVALDAQLLDGFLLLRDARHDGSVLVAEGGDTVSVTAFNREDRTDCFTGVRLQAGLHATVYELLAVLS